jgi:antirestriction protein ArdC
MDLKMNDALNKVWDQLVAKIESNPGIWEKPWFMNAAGISDIPSNFSTKRKYSGFNVFNLEITRLIAGYSSNKWITFNQCANLGGSVLKGSKGTPIIIYNPPKFKEEEIAGEKKDVMIRPPYFGSGYVFNIEQTTLKDDALPVVIEKKYSTIEEVETLIKKTGAVIREIPSNRAYYSPGEDSITLPLLDQFKSVEEYYGTKFHELVHWSGHESRLNRLSKSATFGSASYSREELVAEIGSVFLKTETGINDKVDNAAAYIKNWWGNIKEDRGSLIDACGKAQKATNYILSSGGKNS